MLMRSDARRCSAWALHRITPRVCDCTIPPRVTLVLRRTPGSGRGAAASVVLEDGSERLRLHLWRNKRRRAGETSSRHTTSSAVTGDGVQARHRAARSIAPDKTAHGAPSSGSEHSSAIELGLFNGTAQRERSSLGGARRLHERSAAILRMPRWRLACCSGSRIGPATPTL